ncbi:centrosomal protein of 135 kDa isoform X2 [Wyeomyia smithii]|uniref:centrosomal protein of 135 kDa isoform X2 n=1 Tax=Wyeomyia smithii TaxID=174621 RepID=UPI002467BB4A|nr:centrosomal protein of 135 kDa isoform X2 [Wyeomyia smithii]
MDIDALHCDLRKRLDVLGFNHPLPLGAIGIVSAILDDLIKTSEKLKAARQQIDQLQQEKVAWELGVEPYKCDNSRLLAECNGLHLELVKQRDKFVLANTELKCRVRNLQTDKKHLDERCMQAEAKIRELQSSDCKSKKDGVIMQRKPFISTVRSGYYQPPECCEAQQRESRCQCPCNKPRKQEILHEIERLQAETKNQEEVIEAYKKQIDYRDREIQRLGALFAGGRPSVALAKDCCYRSVNTLSEDVQKLQAEKTSIQNKLASALESQQNASKKIQKLSERNKQLEHELKEIENVALNVESEANLHILDRDRQNSDLNVRLHQSNIRIKELEAMLEAKSPALILSSSSASACSMDSTLQNALKQANEEKRALYKQLNELKQREQTFLNDYEKVKSKYSKLKLKLSQQNVYGQETNQDECELSEQRERNQFLEESLKNVTSDRDFLSSEVKQLRDTVTRLTTEKDNKIAQLESELHLLRKTAAAGNGGRSIKTADSAVSGQSSLSVQSAFHRVERERDAAKREVQQLEIERDSLRNKLKLATKAQKEEQAKHEQALMDYSSQLAKLEATKRDMLCGRNSSQSTIQMLQEENRELQERLKQVEDDFSKLRVSHSQLKMLQEQTERALTQQQRRLMCSENQLGCAEAKLTKVDGTIESANKDIGKLKGDIGVLKASSASLQRENDKLMMELNNKTEKLFTVESELNKLKASKSEMRDNIDRLQKKLEAASVDNIHKESTLRSATSETDTLKKQVATLKRSHDNAVTENGRLSDELTNSASELTLTKRKLADCQQEVERMKSQLREYVQEIQRAEQLLCSKEKEREEMLEHYKSLSEGVNILESSNHTLEAESAEVKKLLQVAEDRIGELQEQLELRQTEIKTYERQINELSTSIVSLEEEVESLKKENSNLREDLEATKDLCSKLDVQKDMLKAELDEHSSIREQLNRENDTLKRQLSLAKIGDKAAVDGLQELLAACRSEVEQQRMITGPLNQEVKSLKSQIEELSEKLAEERDRASKSDALASEYNVQLQELKRMITDDRYAQVQSRQEEDDYNRIKIYLNSIEANYGSEKTLKLRDDLSSVSFSSWKLSESPVPSVARNEFRKVYSSESYPKIIETSACHNRKTLSEPETLATLDMYQVLPWSSFSTGDSTAKYVPSVDNRGSPSDVSDRLAESDLTAAIKTVEKIAVKDGATQRSEVTEAAGITNEKRISKTSLKSASLSESTDLKSPIQKISLDNVLREQKSQSLDHSVLHDIDITVKNESPKSLPPFAQKRQSSNSSDQSIDSLSPRESSYERFRKSFLQGRQAIKSTSSPRKSDCILPSVPVSSVSGYKSPTSSDKFPVQEHFKSPMEQISPDNVLREEKKSQSLDRSAISDIDATGHSQSLKSSPPRIRRRQSSITSNRSIGSLPPRELSYEQVRKSSLQEKPVINSTSSSRKSDSILLPVSVPSIFGVESPTMSEKLAVKSHTTEQNPKQTSPDKTNGRGSTAIIYKNALGERLILADDRQQQQQENDCSVTAHGSIMVIDDLRRPKTPIREPKVSLAAGKAVSGASSSRENQRKSPTVRRSNESGTTTIASTSSRRCEQRKWREILPSKGKTNAVSQTPSLSATTNDRITTINYEILNASGRRRRRSSSGGRVEPVEAANQSGRKPLKLRPITSYDGGGGGGGAANSTPEVTLNGDAEMYVLNFKLKVKGDENKSER